MVFQSRTSPHKSFSFLVHLILTLIVLLSPHLSSQLEKHHIPDPDQSTWLRLAAVRGGFLVFVSGQLQHVVFVGSSPKFASLFKNSSIFVVFGPSMLHFDPNGSRYAVKMFDTGSSRFELSVAQDELQVAQINRASKEYYLNEQSNAAAGATNAGHNTEMPNVALELLQNAVDASCTSATMLLSHRRFSFSHSGSRPFSLVDLTSITSYGASSKVDAAETSTPRRTFIGHKGIGFKAALLVSSSVTIYSPPYQISFNYGKESNKRGVITATITRLAASSETSSSSFASYSGLASTATRISQTDFTLKLRGPHEEDMLNKNLQYLANTLPTLVILKSLGMAISKVQVNETVFQIVGKPQWTHTGGVSTSTIEITKSGGSHRFPSSYHVLLNPIPIKYGYPEDASVCIVLPTEACSEPSVLHAFLPISDYRLSRCEFTIHAPFAVTNSRKKLAKGPKYLEQQNSLWDVVARSLILMIQDLFLKGNIGDCWRLFPIGVKELEQPFLLQFKAEGALPVKQVDESFSLERPSNQRVWNSDQPTPLGMPCVDLTPTWCFSKERDAIARMLNDTIRLSDHELYRDFWNDDTPNISLTTTTTTTSRTIAYDASSPFADVTRSPTPNEALLLPECQSSPPLKDRKWTPKAIGRIRTICTDINRYKKALKALLQIVITESQAFCIFDFKMPKKKTSTTMSIKHIPCQWLRHLSSLNFVAHPYILPNPAKFRQNLPELEFDHLSGNFYPFPGLSITASSTTSSRWILLDIGANAYGNTLLHPRQVIYGSVSEAERDYVPHFQAESGDQNSMESICLALGMVPSDTEQGIALRLRCLKEEHQRRVQHVKGNSLSETHEHIQWALPLAKRLYGELTNLLQEARWNEKTGKDSDVDWSGLLLVQTLRTSSRHQTWSWLNPWDVVLKGPGRIIEGYIKEKHYLALYRMGFRKVSYRFCFDYLLGSSSTPHPSSSTAASLPKSMEDQNMKIVFQSISSIVSGDAQKVQSDEMEMAKQYIQQPVLFSLDRVRRDVGEAGSSTSSLSSFQTPTKRPTPPLIVLPHHLASFLHLFNQPSSSSPGTDVRSRFLLPMLFKCFVDGDRTFAERISSGDSDPLSMRWPKVITRLVEEGHLQICNSLPVIMSHLPRSPPFSTSSNSPVVQSLNEACQMLKRKGWPYDVRICESSSPSEVLVSLEGSLMHTLLRSSSMPSTLVPMKACVVQSIWGNDPLPRFSSSSTSTSSYWTIILCSSSLPSMASVSSSFSSSVSSSSASNPTTSVDTFYDMLRGCVQWLCNLIHVEVGEREEAEEDVSMGEELLGVFQHWLSESSDGIQHNLDRISSLVEQLPTSRTIVEPPHSSWSPSSSTLGATEEQLSSDLSSICISRTTLPSASITASTTATIISTPSKAAIIPETQPTNAFSVSREERMPQGRGHPPSSLFSSPSSPYPSSPSSSSSSRTTTTTTIGSFGVTITTPPTTSFTSTAPSSPVSMLFSIPLSPTLPPSPSSSSSYSSWSSSLPPLQPTTSATSSFSPLSNPASLFSPMLILPTSSNEPKARPPPSTDRRQQQEQEQEQENFTNDPLRFDVPSQPSTPLPRATITILGRELPPTPASTGRNRSPHANWEPTSDPFAAFQNYDPLPPLTFTATKPSATPSPSPSSTPSSFSAYTEVDTANKQPQELSEQEKKLQGDASEAVALAFERHRITQLISLSDKARNAFIRQIPKSADIVAFKKEADKPGALLRFVSHYVQKHPKTRAPFDIYSWHYKESIDKWVPLKVEVKSTRQALAVWDMSVYEYRLALRATPEEPHHIYLYINFRMSDANDLTNILKPSVIITIECPEDLQSIKHEPSHYHFNATAQLKSLGVKPS